MGSGEFGSNGSVHWAIDYGDTGMADHLDYDDTKKHPGNAVSTNPVIGAGKGHAGVFRITARYLNNAQAQKALTAAQAKLGSGKVVELDVDLRPFGAVQAGPGPLGTWEIKVDW